MGIIRFVIVNNVMQTDTIVEEEEITLCIEVYHLHGKWTAKDKRIWLKRLLGRSNKSYKTFFLLDHPYVKWYREEG